MVVIVAKNGIVWFVWPGVILADAGEVFEDEVFYGCAVHEYIILQKDGDL